MIPLSPEDSAGVSLPPASPAAQDVPALSALEGRNLDAAVLSPAAAVTRVSPVRRHGGPSPAAPLAGEGPSSSAQAGTPVLPCAARDRPPGGATEYPAGGLPAIDASPVMSDKREGAVR